MKKRILLIASIAVSSSSLFGMIANPPQGEVVNHPLQEIYDYLHAAQVRYEADPYIGYQILCDLLIKKATIQDGMDFTNQAVAAIDQLFERIITELTVGQKLKKPQRRFGRQITF